MNCRNCQHWFTGDRAQIKMPGRGICLMASTVQSAAVLTLTAEEGNAHALTTVASAFGYEMAINQLETTAKFGCNQHEEAMAE